MIGYDDFAVHAFCLQEQAGLTFKEACVALTPTEMFRDWADRWGCTMENVYNLSRKGQKKLRDRFGNDENRINELIPVRFYHIL